MTRGLLFLVATAAWAAAQPPAADPALLREIQSIRAIDNHAHVVRPVAGDADYDALPFALLDPPPAGVIPAPVAP
jgi:hypothetical protein